MTNGFSVKAEKLMSLFMKSNVQTNKQKHTDEYPVLKS